MLALFLSTCIVIMVLTLKETLPIDEVSYSLIACIDIMTVISYGIRMASELNTIMICTKRIIEYTNLESEDDLVKPIDD